MRVLVGCEFSGRVRKAFEDKGHDAVSCDLEPSEIPGMHIQGDILDNLKGWDMIIAFPPCTHLARSGFRWYYGSLEMYAAIEFVKAIWAAPCDKVCIENPVGALSTYWYMPSQKIHPWQHGHGEKKTTCLWHRGLPYLQPSNVVSGREPKIHYMNGYDKRNRSITYQGIADAMAEQWG